MEKLSKSTIFVIGILIGLLFSAVVCILVNLLHK